DFYLAIQNPEDDFWRDKPGIKQYIKELKLYQIKQTNSLFLSALKNLTLDKVEKLAKICAVISFRYNVIGGLNPNAQEDVYNTIALSIHNQGSFDLKSFASIYVNDLAFENDFSIKEFKSTTRNHKIVKFIFSKLELFSNKNEINPESDSYSIEHILPENPDSSWNMFNDEAIKRSVYRLGNLTLLEKKINKDAGNLSYAEKRKLFLQSTIEISKEISDTYETWTEEKIATRQKDLATKAKRIWRVEGL
ncbi:MAG: HNH endonuclease family protein, partial [Bacteroidota bacterium]|nr:HNH endonuclease family protein [Bacteroidota bacterium]